MIDYPGKHRLIKIYTIIQHFQEDLNAYSYTKCRKRDARRSIIGTRFQSSLSHVWEYPMISRYNMFLVATCGTFEKKPKANVLCLDVCRAEPITRCSWIKYTYIADTVRNRVKGNNVKVSVHTLYVYANHTRTYEKAVAIVEIRKHFTRAQKPREHVKLYFDKERQNGKENDVHWGRR